MDIDIEIEKSISMSKSPLNQWISITLDIQVYKSADMDIRSDIVYIHRLLIYIP